MGGKWSKNKIAGWSTIRERIRRTEPAAEGVGAVSRDLEKHGAITSSNTAHTNAACALARSTRRGRGSRFSSQTSGTVKTNDLQGSCRSEPLLREKGGLEGLIWAPKRQEILDLWVYHTQGLFPDWQNYTPGPGIRYPLTFGWCFQLVPVDPKEVEEDTGGENSCLLHPKAQHGMEDLEREVLVWRFNSRLAFEHKARIMHPEFYKNC
uniref:Protein Nef n=1 Tax=Human immunodeficiency virus type 1 TaxID=11676 RepID=O72630_HV1|nr:nef protein [Human immunodeficiency virus 1]